MNNPPNLLFIFTDEQRFDTLPHAKDRPSAYPDGCLSMPNLEKFAGTACVVEEAYCTQPVCTPSRGSIMTGLWPRTHGAFHNNIPLYPSSRTLPECLPNTVRQNYTTAYHGKWHLGDEIFAQHGFDDWVSFEDEYAPYYSKGRDQDAKCDYNHWLRQHGFKPPAENGTFPRGHASCLPEPFTKPAFLAEKACEFLEANKERSFIQYVNFLEPHMPFFGPMTERYDPAEVPLPKNFKDQPGEDNPRWLKKARQRATNGFEWYDLSSEAGWRQMIAAYMGLNTLIDKYTGQILDKLEELGLSDNTIVVFTSDHGEMMGSHGLVGKQCMYQESIRVPLLIRLPGQDTPVRIKGPMSQIDLVPTLLELMDQSTPGHLHGTSRAGLLQAGQDASLDEPVYVTWNTTNDSGQANPAKSGDGEELEDIVTRIDPEGWRFSLGLDSGLKELFDLRNDPLERINLAADPSHTERVQELTHTVQEWWSRMCGHTRS